MMMMMASRPKLSEAAWYKRFKKNTNPRPTKNSNYVKHIEQTLVKQSSRDDDVIFNLDSYSKFELKQLKEKFMSKIERIEGFVKQIEARELELLKLEEDVNSKKLGQKRVVQGPDPLNKRRCLVKTTTELNSVEEMRKCGVIRNFRNPLAENAEKPVQIHPVEALPKKICKEVAKITGCEQLRTIVPDAKKNPRMRREMSDLERDRLGRVLQDFGDEYLVEILQIVGKRNSNMTTPDGDMEIELDMEALDSETMWDLHTFFRLKLKAEENNKAI